MKRGIVLVVVAMMMLPVFGRISSAPQPAKKYADVITGLGLSCPEFVSFRTLVGDTICFRTYTAKDGDTFFGIEYVTPDTIWIKQKKKKPVEGKHYYLLHSYGSSYELDGKNVTLYDYTKCYQICDEENGVAFRIDEYIGDSVMRATEIKSQRQIVFNPNKLHHYLFMRSAKYDRYYQQLIRKSYYTYQQLSAVKKQYTKHVVREIETYLDFQGRLLLNTDINTQHPFATHEQYVTDSIAEAKFEEEFNRPHELNYFVDKNASILDVAIQDKLKDYSKAILKSRIATIGQTITAGKIEMDAILSKDDYFWFVGIDSICGKEYIIGGKNGKYFYIAPDEVTIDWKETDSEGTLHDHTHNSRIIDIYRGLSPEQKHAYTEYMKNFVYAVYEELKTPMQQSVKQATAKGLIIKELRPTTDYYSTGLDFSFINKSSKTIKYIVLTTKGLNPVKDPISTETVRGIGPIEPGELATYEFENVWWTDLVSSHRPISLVITYMDGSTRTLNSKDIDACWLDEDVLDMLEVLEEPKGLKCGIYDPKTGKKESYPKY